MINVSSKELIALMVLLIFVFFSFIPSTWKAIVRKFKKSKNYDDKP